MLKENNLLHNNLYTHHDNNSIQVGNSLANTKLKENTHSRCIKSINSEDENKSKFLIGCNTNTNSYIIEATYDIETKKISTEEIVNFENIYKEKNEEKIINDIVGIYTNSFESTSHMNDSLGDNLNNSFNKHNDKRFFTQVFNQSENKYQLKGFKNEEGKYICQDFPVLDSSEIFEIKFSNENNLLYCITSENITQVDINKSEHKEIIINFENLKNSNNQIKHLKICSDVSKIDNYQLAVGISTDLYIVDLNSKKILNKIENAHYNGILSCEFDPFKSFILATTGMDYSVKFWDTRNLSTPLTGIFGNSHWIWDLKYNKRFSRVMITCSSSSIVRGIVFDKEKDFEDSEEGENFANKNTIDNRRRSSLNLNHQFNISHLQNPSSIDYVEFEDSVYSLDWAINDPWIFGAVSYNSYFYINSIPEDIKYKIMLDN